MRRLAGTFFAVSILSSYCVAVEPLPDEASLRKRVDEVKARFHIGNAREIERPFDEKVIRRMVADWTKAFNTGNIKTVADQFEGYVLDRMGIDSINEAMGVEPFIQRDLELYYKGYTHSFSIDDIWWVWNATAIPHDMYWMAFGAAVVEFTHEAVPPSLAGRPPTAEKAKMTGVLMQRDGEWKWILVWPVMPLAGCHRPKAPSGLLDGTVWFVPDVGGVREPEILVFQDGRALIGSDPPKMCGTNMKNIYSSKKVGKKIRWASRTWSDKMSFREMSGEVSGNVMTGADRVASPVDGIEDRWAWVALRLR